MIGRISTAVAIAYALAMIAIIFLLAKVPTTPGELIFDAVIIVWTAFPVTGLLMLLPPSKKALVVSVLGMIFAGYIYLEILVLNPDAQSGIGLIFIPLYQLALAGSLWGLHSVARRALQQATK